MAIPAIAQPEPLMPLVEIEAIVDPKTGHPTEYFMQLMQELRDYVNGANRLIPCSASGTNVITLTPNSISPKLERYNDYEIFTFRAAAASTGAVTATAMAGSAALPVYLLDGTLQQAASGDIVQDAVYFLMYASHLNSGNGGFFLK